MEVSAIVPFGWFWLINTLVIRLSEYDYMLALGHPLSPTPSTNAH